MSGTLQLALRSLANRRTTALLTVCSIAVSVALLLGVLAEYIVWTIGLGAIALVRFNRTPAVVVTPG